MLRLSWKGAVWNGELWMSARVAGEEGAVNTGASTAIAWLRIVGVACPEDLWIGASAAGKKGAAVDTGASTAITWLKIIGDH